MDGWNNCSFTWRENNHPCKGVSINKLIVDQHGTIKETNQNAHLGLETMHGYIGVPQQGVILIHIEVERKKLDPMFTFH
jgi:hypothetical protein